MKKLLNRYGIIFIVLILFLLSDKSACTLFAADSKPCKIELVENWKFISSHEVHSEAAAISAAGNNNNLAISIAIK